MVERPPTILKETDKFGTKFMAEDMGANIRSKAGAPMSVVITTFVDLNDLARTSVLGRILAEKMIDEMNRQGFTVIELRRAQDLFVKKDGGEFILTRDVGELSKTTSASALLAGTYLATSNTIIINARLMDIKTPRVLATVSYEMNKTDEIEGMLKGSNP
jgi:TolB-like protein